MKLISHLSKKVNRFGSLYSLYFVFWFMCSFLIMVLFAQIERNNDIKLVSKESEIQLKAQRDLLLEHFRDIESDLSFLPQLNEMLRYREIKSEKERIQVGNEFLEFSKSKDQYDQIRFLDEHGNEIVRVNRNDGKPELIAFEKLQNKGDRYYFLETMALDQGEFYISPFDLNIEKNKIEQPIKPMIRFATPVFDTSGKKKGIVILNYLGVQIIDNLKLATEKNPGVFSLINNQGFWLYNDDKEREWGFMYPEKNNTNYSSFFPESWEQMTGRSYFQSNEDNYIKTSIQVKPYLQSDKGSENSWFLMNTIPYDQIGVRWSQILYRNRFLGIVILVLDFIVAFILARSNVEKLTLSSKIKQMALYDNLTGLPNRYLLYDRIKLEISQSVRYQSSFALFYIDLDGFKEINDSLGHDAGDQLLIKMGELLRKTVRAADTVSRIGGDELMILISHIQSPQNCILIAEKILIQLSNPIFLDKGSVQVGASIGIVISNPNRKEGIEELMRNADSAMYDVKKHGKNNFKIYEG